MSTERVLDYVRRFAKQTFRLPSNQEIAAKLGITTNAVAGALHRLKMDRVIEVSGGNSPIGRLVCLMEHSDSAIARKEPMMRWDNVVIYTASKGPQPRKCQYMAGDDYVICGKAVERGSYCLTHYALTHVQPVLKPREAYR